MEKSSLLHVFNSTKLLSKFYHFIHTSLVDSNKMNRIKINKKREDV